MYPFVFLGRNSERNVIFGWTIPLRSSRGNQVSSQRVAACCRVLLFIQSESSCALLISLFLPEWEERGETANYSPAQHIIHTLRCEPMERQMIFCFKIIRFISISVLSRISHLFAILILTFGRSFFLIYFSSSLRLHCSLPMLSLSHN